ncbi:hypothetical protein GB937_003898 [Aspergillus fischeri]|nr:hypothetical protein GB937_003898 [Aspergillus fischeri]
MPLPSYPCYINGSMPWHLQARGTISTRWHMKRRSRLARISTCENFRPGHIRRPSPQAEMRFDISGENSHSDSVLEAPDIHRSGLQVCEWGPQPSGSDSRPLWTPDKFKTL